MNKQPAGPRGLDPLFRPTSVAVVGASQKPNSIGGAILANLFRDGFSGRIYAVNPNADTIMGLAAHPSLADIGHPVDLVVIAVPARFVESVVDDCIASSTRGIAIITSGFAESSEQGRQTEKRIIAKTRAAGIRTVGPNCMGLLNTDGNIRLNVTFTPIWPPTGNIGILSQSGALGLTILDHVRELNLGISSFISVGNKADVSGNDLIEYWADDPNTDVILLYLESFGNPRKFGRIAPRVVRKKPIVAVKAGRSAAGRRAASSHSAALASMDVAVDALFEQSGVLRTDTLESMFDVAALLATQPLPAGPRVGVVSNAGGPSILLADACEAEGLKLPELTPETIKSLREFLPPHAGFQNPVDLVGSDQPEDFYRAVRMVGSDPGIDAVIVIFIPPLLTTRPEDVGAAIARAAGEIPANRPVLNVFLSSRGTPEMLGSGPRGRIPSYRYPENAANSLAASYRLSQWRSRPEGQAFRFPEPTVARIRAIIESAQATVDEPGWLSSDLTAELLDTIGVSMARAEISPLESAADAADRLGYPVVLKAVAPGLVHKSDVGGVVLDLDSADEVRDAITQLKSRMKKAGLNLEGVLVQRQIASGIEMIVGTVTDPVFGPLVVCGMGGVHVEVLKDVAFRLTPVRDSDAKDMIAGLKSLPLLRGYRGSPLADEQALASTIMKVSALIEVAPEILDLDLNPLMVLEPGKGIVVADARIRVQPKDAATDFPRPAKESMQTSLA